MVTPTLLVKPGKVPQLDESRAPLAVQSLRAFFDLHGMREAIAGAVSRIPQSDRLCHKPLVKEAKNPHDGADAHPPGR